MKIKNITKLGWLKNKNTGEMYYFIHESKNKKNRIAVKNTGGKFQLCDFVHSNQGWQDAGGVSFREFIYPMVWQDFNEAVRAGAKILLMA